MQEHHEARSIVETLVKAGFIAYYAGGWVRDFLLNHPSDDIDIATSALPEDIQALFPHTIPVGIAFGIVVVVIGKHQYEVATFRSDFDYQDGRRPNQIAFTTAEKDAMRRDFTINGMFYDPLNEKILDFVGGEKDLKEKVIRAIGHPEERFREDRLRMVRAIRLSCRFGFTIEPKTKEAILFHAKELFPAVAIERVWQELTKADAFQKLKPTLIELHEATLLGVIFPELASVSTEEISKRISCIDLYPRKSPTIASILALFPSCSFSFFQDLCKRLKRSNEELAFVAFYCQAKHLLADPASLDPYQWSELYAHPLSEMCLEIFAAELEGKKRADFIRLHETQRAKLSRSIAFLKNKKPPLSAEDLMQAGIKPGPLFGKLLKEGEKMAANENIFDKDQILAQLKRLPLWPS